MPDTTWLELRQKPVLLHIHQMSDFFGLESLEIKWLPRGRMLANRIDKPNLHWRIEITLVWIGIASSISDWWNQTTWQYYVNITTRSTCNLQWQGQCYPLQARSSCPIRRLYTLVMCQRYCRNLYSTHWQWKLERRMVCLLSWLSPSSLANLRLTSSEHIL